MIRTSLISHNNHSGAWTQALGVVHLEWHKVLGKNAKPLNDILFRAGVLNQNLLDSVSSWVARLEGHSVAEEFSMNGGGMWGSPGQLDGAWASIVGSCYCWLATGNWKERRMKEGNGERGEISMELRELRNTDDEEKNLWMLLLLLLHSWPTHLLLVWACSKTPCCVWSGPSHWQPSLWSCMLWKAATLQLGKQLHCSMSPGYRRFPSFHFLPP